MRADGRTGNTRLHSVRAFAESASKPNVSTPVSLWTAATVGKKTSGREAKSETTQPWIHPYDAVEFKTCPMKRMNRKVGLGACEDVLLQCIKVSILM